MGTRPFWKQRQAWTMVMGLAALAFWVVGLGAGWRGWILASDGGIVHHAQAFGVEANIWWIPATVLTLTTVLMGIGISIIRHLVDDVVEVTPGSDTRREEEPVSEEVSADDAAVDGGPDDRGDAQAHSA